MAGIWDRLSPNTVTVENRLSPNAMNAVFVLRAISQWTDVQIRDKINEVIDQDLTSAELTDMQNIGSQMDLQVTTLDKIAYAQRIFAASSAVRDLGMTESQMKTILGI